jgi:dihydrofolate reductase
VATRSGAPLTWENSVAMTDAASEIAKLKQENGPTLLTQGSSKLVQSLLAADLVDEVRLITFPVLLGKGKRFFGDNAQPRAYKLTRSKTSAAGVTLANYERAGEVETGSFGQDQPSDLGKARRDRVKREG